MANTFSAELLISTTKANKDIQAMEGQVRSLDKSLAGLGKTLQSNQKDLDAAVKSISAIVNASRDASKASDEAAKAKLSEAKAQAELNKAENASQIAAARVERERSATAVNQSTVAYRTARTEAVQFAHAQREISANTDKAGNSLANQRYLLYDVGATYRTLGIAAAALPTAAIAAATSYEKSFAQVLRVTGETSASANELRHDLKQLATEIPMSFAELANIAQIGGQMDVPTDQLAAFTDTVAKFVATADGATIDSSTQAFGRLNNLFNTNVDGTLADPEFFQRIGAAISYTADNAVTSEAKIVSMLEKLAPVGAQAGLAAQEVVAFGSALSSVGLQPEISSGFFTRFFGQINKDVAAGGKELAAYNKVLGTTSDEFRQLYMDDPSSVLQQVVGALSDMDKISRTSVLGELGIKATRDQRVIAGLAENYHVLEKAIEDTNYAYAKGTYLDTSSAGIFGTLAANVEKLANSFMNLGDTVGSGILDVFSDLVGRIQWMVDGLNELANVNPVVKTVLTTLMGLSSVLGVFFALRSAQAFLTAGLVTLNHVTKQAGQGGFNTGNQMRMLAESMLRGKGASDALTASILKQNGALRALAVAQGTTASSIATMNAQMEQTGVVATGSTGGIRGMASSLLGLAGGPIGIAVIALGTLGSAWYRAGLDAQNSMEEMARAAEVGGEALSRIVAEDLGRNVGFRDGGFINMGKSYQDLADSIGVSTVDITKAMLGGVESMDEFIAKLQELKDARNEQRSGFIDRETNKEVAAYGDLINKLLGVRHEMEANERAASDAEQANKELGLSAGEAGDLFGEASDEVRNWTQELNAAIEAAFGLTNAQAGLEGSLEKLGAGLQKDSGIGLGTEGSRSNLANFQQVLAQQAAVLQQSIQAGEISAQQAAQNFQSYAVGLMQQLEGMGVDTSGLMADVDNAISEVQATFAEQGGIVMPVSVDGNQAVMEADYLMSWLGDYLASPQYVKVASSGTDETANDVNRLINYIAEVTGLPFEAVVDAITNPASTNTALVADYMLKVVSADYTANINADTSTAISNVRNFAVYAGNQLAELMRSLSSTGSVDLWAQRPAPSFSSPAVLATPAVQAAKANRAVLPSLDALNRGYNDAARAAGGAGKAAGGAGKKAKKAGSDAAKGAKDASKALQDQAKDWDELEKQISGYASRVGTAFGYVTARQTGVQEAKDEYYSILNGIKERLEQQKQAVRDLRAENKLLNAERRVQLNDAAKLEKMAGYADQMGNAERAKVYRDEAKALREGATETQAKITANEKEARSIEKGIGSTKGYTKEAIENRKELRNLRNASLAVAEAYAASGASAKTVARETAAWTNRAKAHGTQLGYTKTAVDRVMGSTRSYVNALKAVPKTINTNLNAKNNTASGVNAAKKSLGSIPASKTSTIKAQGSGIGSVNKQLNDTAKNRTVTISTKIVGTLRKKDGAVFNVYSDGRQAFSGLYMYNRGGLAGRDGMKRFNRGGLVPGTPPANPRADNIMATLDGDGMAAIRSGEYIQSQPAVDYYGTDIMDKLNRMEIPRYALGGTVGNSKNNANNTPSVIDLSAETIQSIARLVEKDIYLYADTQMLAQSVHKGNEVFAQRGGKY